MEGNLIVAETGKRAATERQVNYIRSLIRRDPGEASNHGLNLDTDLTALSLERASHLIDCLA